MNDELKRQAIEAMITKTYEDLGMAIVDIEAVGVASFRVTIIDDKGIRDALVTVLLHMINVATA